MIDCPWNQKFNNIRLLIIIFAAIISIISVNTDETFAANGGVVYTYDALGRVTTASYDTGAFIIYTYDANGNRTSQSVNINTTTLVWGTGKWGQTLW